LLHFRDAAGIDPSNAVARYTVGSLLGARGELAAARDQFTAALELKPDWIPAVASLAWLLATAPEASIRDSDRAVRFAERAADLTERRDASALDILAAAYAADGRFDEAVATSDQALTHNPDPALERSIRTRQALYRRRQPYRSR
jgi:tetratricopeptide (TPR) repeat protein